MAEEGIFHFLGGYSDTTLSHRSRYIVLMIYSTAIYLSTFLSVFLML